MLDFKVLPGRVGQAQPFSPSALQPFSAGEQVRNVVRAQPVPETGACTSGDRRGLRQRKARGKGAWGLFFGSPGRARRGHKVGGKATGRVSTKAWRRCNRFASAREAKKAPGQGLDCLWQPARGQWRAH